MIKRLLSVLAVAVLVAACGGDSTSPSQSTPNVAGAWTFNASNISGGGVSCNILGTSLQLNQTGTTFSGTYSGADLLCVSGGMTLVDESNVSGTVVNGQVSSSGSVSFDFDTQDLHQSGNISGNSMSGTATWRMDFGGTIGVVTFSGSWSAAR